MTGLHVVCGVTRKQFLHTAPPPSWVITSIWETSYNHSFLPSIDQAYAHLTYLPQTMLFLAFPAGNVH